MADILLTSENNCAKTNEGRHTLSAVQIFGMDSSFWQYKVCADIRSSAVLIGLKFTVTHYKFEISQASKARLQSSKHTGTKKNLTQNGDSTSFKVTCFGISGKAIRHKVILYNNFGVIS